MVRRRGRRRGRGRGRRGGNYFQLTVPFAGAAGEGTTQEITFKSIFFGATAQTLAGVPWRITKVVYQFANSGFILQDQKELPSSQPAFFQICLNAALADNVEAISSRRHLSTITTQRGRLFTPSPNPWKEDEDRSQSIITIDNIHLGGGTNNTVISYLLHITIQFGAIPYAHAASKLYQSRHGENSAGSSPFSGSLLEEL